jgi:hypothetical protein
MASASTARLSSAESGARGRARSRTARQAAAASSCRSSPREQRRQARERVAPDVPIDSARRHIERHHRAGVVARALVDAAERETLGFVAAPIGAVFRQLQRPRHHAGQRQQVVAVVIQHAHHGGAIARAKEVEVPRGNLETRHVPDRDGIRARSVRAL